MSALSGQAMNDLGVTNFQDYLIQLPGVTAGGSGPGQNTIYIRGLASTTPNLTTAGVAGLAPNVAFYLDEQPLSQPGRNLDVYTADMNRVEVLPGPQGTLFGASSQAGTVRLITNKPDPTGTYANVKMGTAFTENGEPSNNVEAMLNVPVSDQLTLRGVVYVDNQGGYIDNVAGTRDASESARFRPAGTVRANGVPVSDRRAGFQAVGSETTEGPLDLDDVTFLEADNGNRVQDDFNETTYSGARLSGLWDINRDWSLLLSHMRQSLDTEGVFFADPNLDDYEIQRYEEDEMEDEFGNTAWTLNGRVRDLELVYTGAYTDRETDQVIDYTDYLFAGQYLPYYICDSAVTYPGDVNGVPNPPGEGTCQPPNAFVKSTTETEVQTHEIRINTPEEHSIRATLGAFYSDLELKERNDYTYLGSTDANVFGSPGFSDNFPFQTGYRSDEGPFPPGVIFRNDVKRTDEQMGLFGEVTWDFTETLALTLGARWYDIEVDLEGSANGSFCNSFQPDVNAFGTDISDLYNGDGEITFRGDCNPATQAPVTVDTQLADMPQAFQDLDGAASTLADPKRAAQAPDTASTDGVIGKVSLSWRPTDNALVYGTWSEGFRPGLLNRPGGASGPGNYTVPFALETDEVVNWELGWKLDLLDRTLRFNGNAFYVEVDDLQTTIFDPSIVNLFFSDNAANAEIKGVEGDFIWTPAAVEGLTVSGAFSYLDTEITDKLVPTDDVREGDELAYAPEFQGNLRARYQWFTDSGLQMHVMPHMSYSAEQNSDIIVINRDTVDSWVMFGVTARRQQGQLVRGGLCGQPARQEGRAGAGFRLRS
ncbi:MAG: TonB-dependent receptor [Gammaproteobacteria bacterium]|nr:TonB-dependent receptor [Gammaproteobacteria bacterium]